jgi:CcmD family protein
MDSVSFSGSTFTSEKFDFNLHLTITQSQSGEIVANSTFKIDINKPSDDDMFYLWGGMTVFWVAIGAYVLYLSSQFRELNKKVERIEK